MTITPDAEHANTPSASPLGRALAARSEAHFADLTKARGLAGDTFATLAERASVLVERCNSTKPSDGTAALSLRASTLRAVARLLDDPSATEIPPPNDGIYDAVLDTSELEMIIETLAPRTPIERLLAHLAHPDSHEAIRDRAALSFAAICRRAGIAVSIPEAKGGTILLELKGWPIAASPAVPLDIGSVSQICADSESALKQTARPGLIVLEAGAMLPPDPLRVAEDSTAIAAMNDRLDSLMLEIRDDIIETIGPSANAFGLVVRATMPATNVASRRLLFAQCVRAVNLCDTNDSRIEGFQSFADTLARADHSSMS